MELKAEQIKGIVDTIRELAEVEVGSDNENFNPYDASGGNFDDAYQMGLNDGEILLARQLMGYLRGGK